MSADEFRQFADKLEAGDETPAPEPRIFSRVAIIGATPEGQLLSCLCLAEGAEVTLYSPYGSELDAIRAGGGITLRGTGPVGTYHVDRSSGPSIRLTGDLDAATAGSDLIILAGPVLRQRAAAYALGRVLTVDQTIAVVPGRSFGAIETAWTFRAGGCTVDITIIEAQNLCYRIRRDGSVLWLTRSVPGAVASLPGRREAAIRGFLRFIHDAAPVANIVESSFADASSAVELPALLLGGPAAPSAAAEIPAGGVALAERATFRSLLGEHHLRLVSAMCAERRQVAARWGIHELPDDADWLDIHAGALAGDHARHIPSAVEADILARCAVVGSLMPLCSAAELAGVDTPATHAVSGIALAALGGGLAATGRSIQSIGITANRIEDARRAIDTIAREGF
ncbi:MAG: hypothetical protein OXF74_08030 [Rhodobacteraceae bacterium]|nr:hypothetical protein [Paracoccaceae bacterium]